MTVISHEGKDYVSVSDEELQPILDGFNTFFQSREVTGLEAALIMTVLIEKFCAQTGTPRDEFWEVIKAGERGIRHHERKN